MLTVMGSLMDVKQKFILYIISRLGEIKGKKALQKIVYFASKATNIDFGYRMYWYGPFSREVAEILDILALRGYVEIEPVDNTSIIRSKTKIGASPLKGVHFGAIDRLLRYLGRLEPRTPELLATLDFLMDSCGFKSVDEVYQKIRELKGDKFSAGEIKEGLRLLENIRELYSG